METLLRAALLEWLRADPALTGALNLIAEEAPRRATPPWLGLVASASTDWSTKTQIGREVRVAFEFHARGDDPRAAAQVTQAVEARITTLPSEQHGFVVASVIFLRARAEQRAANTRAVLLEYRFRLLATDGLQREHTT